MLSTNPPTNLLLENIFTDKKGGRVYHNMDTTQNETEEQTDYTLGSPMEGEQLKYFISQLEVPNARIISRPQPRDQNPNNPSSEMQLNTLIGQMGLLQENGSVQNLVYNSSSRDHWYGIQLKMNRKGYIVAKIADSLKPDYSTDSHAKIEHDELLKAIKAHNKAVWNKRKNIEGVVARRKAYQDAEDKSEFKYNGKAYRQRKSDDAVQIVSCYAQNIQNSCGLHTGLNLYLMNKDPNITNTSQFGQALEGDIQNTQQAVNLFLLAQQIKKTYVAEARLL